MSKENLTRDEEEKMREWWRSIGGDFHGPITEHASIEEEKLLPVLFGLLSNNVDREKLKRLVEIAEQGAKLIQKSHFSISRDFAEEREDERRINFIQQFKKEIGE